MSAHPFPTALWSFAGCWIPSNLLQAGVNGYDDGSFRFGLLQSGEHVDDSCPVLTPGSWSLLASVKSSSLTDPFADPQWFAQRHATAFVAKVAAIGEVIGSVFAYKSWYKRPLHYWFCRKYKMASSGFDKLFNAVAIFLKASSRWWADNVLHFWEGTSAQQCGLSFRSHNHWARRVPERNVMQRIGADPFDVASSAMAFAPFSQYSASPLLSSSGSGQAQLGQSNPPFLVHLIQSL